MAFFTKIAGVTFNNTGENIENRQNIIRDLSQRGLLNPGQQLSLALDANNPYDPNAVKVIGPDGRQLGYLPRNVASDISGKMKKGITYRVLVTTVTGGENGYNYGVNIEITELLPVHSKVTTKESAIGKSKNQDVFPITISVGKNFHDTCWGLSYDSPMKLINNRFVTLLSELRFSSATESNTPTLFRDLYTYDIQQDKIINKQQIVNRVIYDFISFKDGSIYYISSEDISKQAVLYCFFDKQETTIMRYMTDPSKLSLIGWNDKLLVLGNVRGPSKKHLIAIVDLERHYTAYVFAYDGALKNPWVEYYCIHNDYLIFSIAENAEGLRYNPCREMYIINLSTGISSLLKRGQISNIHFTERGLFYNNSDYSYSAILDFENLKIIEEKQIAIEKVGTVINNELLYTIQTGPYATVCDGEVIDADPSVFSQLYAVNYLNGEKRCIGACDFKINQAIYVDKKILISGTTPGGVFEEQFFAVINWEEPSANFEDICLETEKFEIKKAETTVKENNEISKTPVQEKTKPNIIEIDVPKEVSKLDISVVNAPQLYGIGHATRVKQVNKKVLISIDFSQGKKERQNMSNCVFPIDAFGEKLLAKEGDTPVNFIKMLFSVIPELNLEKSESEPSKSELTSEPSKSELTEETLQKRYSSGSYLDKEKSEISELAALSEIKILRPKEEKTVSIQTKLSKKDGIQTVICPKCHSLVASNLSVCPSCEASLKNAIHFPTGHSDNPTNTKNDDEANWPSQEEREFPKALSDEYNIDDFESDYYETNVDKYYEELERLYEDYPPYGNDW